MKFTKMHGCGNDYIYINGFEEVVDKSAHNIKNLSDRNFGIGGDGVVFINPSLNADFEMEMYNSDGTRAEMCGNAIRCVARYVYDKKMTDKTNIAIESYGKIKYAELFLENKIVKNVRINMGEPELVAQNIPVIFEDERVINEKITVGEMDYNITCVSLGNPHCVVFVEDVDTIDIEKVGPLFENHKMFPKRINTEFVRVIDKNNVQMRVWERGAGETLACGTGASATLVACYENGLTNKEINVELKGGVLKVSLDIENNNIFLSGPAEYVFSGEVI